MKAVVIRSGESVPSVADVPDPLPDAGEVLIRTLRVGIDGTDHEVVEGNYGDYPPGEDYQILGHEAVGVVEDANGTSLEEGQLVVPTVRRPPPGEETNEYFERDEPDMAPDGAYVERGIVGAHGYMSEYFTSPAEFLVPVPTRSPSTDSSSSRSATPRKRSSTPWPLGRRSTGGPSLGSSSETAPSDSSPSRCSNKTGVATRRSSGRTVSGGATIPTRRSSTSRVDHTRNVGFVVHCVRLHSTWIECRSRTDFRCQR